MIITLVLLLITLGFVVWPAFSHRNVKISREAENLRLYEQRKKEIADADYSAEEREQMLLELDLELVSSDSDIATGGDVSPKTKILSAFAIFIIMVSSVLYLYQDMGAQDEIIATQLLNKMSTAQLTGEEQKTLKESLRKASISKPKNGEWAYLYARMLYADGQYAEGVTAFENILTTIPDEAKADKSATLVQIAQGKFYLSQQKATPEIYSLVEQALELEPNNSQALGLAGVIAFELNYFEDAFGHWKTLWFNISNSADASALEQAIQRLVTILEEQGKTVDVSWMKRAEIKVFVSISDELNAQLNESDAVFVMAKALTGPAMPLAAVRLMAKDLPLEVSLNDSQGMVPGVSLSKFEEVQIIARVAKGGKPMASAGDLQGIISPVSVKGTDSVTLVIDQVVE